MRNLFAAFGVALLFPGLASAQFEVVINNGLAPPTPANVIDSWSDWFDTHFVRNQNCPPGWPAVYAGNPCPAPGGPTAAAIVTGGRVMTLYVTETSSATLDGGWVDQLYAEDAASAVMDAGTLEYLVARNTATAGVNGGDLEYLWGRNDGMISMTGGEVYMVNAFDASHFTMTGGHAEYVVVADDATATLSDGEVDYVNTDGNAVVMLTDVTAGYLIARGSSQVTVMGGEIGYSEALDDAAIVVVGAGFRVDGVPVGYGALTAETGILTGRLASGEDLVHEFHQGEDPGGEFTGTLSLAGAPAAPVPAVTTTGLAMVVAGIIAVVGLPRVRRSLALRRGSAVRDPSGR